MMRYIILLFVAILLFSCKESELKKIARLVNKWNGKVIQFPDSMCLTFYGTDTVMTKYIRKQSFYTILNYVDTAGCMSCRLQLPRWKEMIEELDSIFPNKVNFLMVFYPKKKRQLIKHLRNNQYNYFVYIDEKDTLNRMNIFLSEEDFCTFLLDNNDKIIAIGNPILNPKIKELYLNIISGKKAIDKTNTPQTTASISEVTIDMGEFDWNKKQETEITISNTGNGPLVISDVTTSCGCTTVGHTKEPIMPKKSGILQIIYQAEHPEHFSKTVSVHCNTPTSPIQIKVTGNAK